MVLPPLGSRIASTNVQSLRLHIRRCYTKRPPVSRWPIDSILLAVPTQMPFLPLDLSGVFYTLARSLLMKVLAYFPSVSVSHLDDHSIHQVECITHL